MDKLRTVHLKAILAIALLCLAVASAHALPAVTITQPSGQLNLGEDLDYMSHAWHDSWDMNEESDLHFFISPTCDGFSAMFSNTSFSSGIWSGSYATNDPWLWLLDPGYRNSLHVGKNGNVHPIDANTYTQLTFRMYLGDSFSSNATPGAKLIWTRKDALSIPSEPSEFGTSKFFRIFPGWYVYTIDLTQIGIQQGSLNWGGSITGLRLYPGIQTSGLNNVKIDWVRLTPKPSERTVAWSGASGGTVELLFSTDDVSYDPLKVYSNNEQVTNIIEPDTIPAGSGGVGSYDVPASFPPGSVYVKVKSGAETSAVGGPWQFNARPDLSFKAPSYTGGEEFSASVVGNTWDMSDSADVAAWEYLTGAPTYSGGVLQATSTYRPPNCGMPWGDPQLTLNMGGQSVDPYYYRYLTVRVKMNTTFDFGNGWVSRFVWAKGDYDNRGVSNDMPLYSGWNTFHVDLWGDILDDEDPGTGDNAWQSSSWPTILRFDPHEIPPSTQFEVDYVKLTANDTASRGSIFEVKYELDDSGNVTTTFYYDTDTNPDNGRTLAEEYTPMSPSPTGPYFVYLPLMLKQYPALTGTFRWDLSNVNAGTYYLCADVDDGYDTTTWYSETPVIITAP